MHLLDAPAILDQCEEEQRGTCIQSLGLCCSQPGMHLSTSKGEKLVSCCYRCKNIFLCNDMRAEIISSDHKRHKRQNCEIFHIWLRAETFYMLSNAAMDLQHFYSL